jgi:hypothetical protein
MLIRRNENESKALDSYNQFIVTTHTHAKQILIQ